MMHGQKNIKLHNKISEAVVKWTNNQEYQFTI